MANRKKRGDKKRNLKYGHVLKTGQGPTSKKKEIKEIGESGQEFGFKKEIRKNLLYVGSFTIFLILIFLLLTKTDVINPILNLLGLKGLY